MGPLRRESTPARSAARPDLGARTVWRTVSTSTSSSPPRCPLRSEGGGAAAEPPVTAPILPEPAEQVNQSHAREGLRGHRGWIEIYSTSERSTETIEELSRSPRPA